MELKGKVHFIGKTVDVSDKFKKREVVIEYIENPQYPEFIKLEANQDRCNLLDNVKVGDNIDASFNLKGREWVNKEGVKQYFNTLALWKITVTSSSVSSAARAELDKDDLPF